MKYAAVVLLPPLLFGATALSTGVNGGGRKRQSKLNKSAVDAIALKIGLNVVVPNKSNAGAGAVNVNKTRHKKRAKRPPTISWGKNAQRFFWGDAVDDGFQHQQKQLNVHRSHGGRQLKVERACNNKEFPLYQIHDVLPQQSLDQALSLLMDDSRISSAEELEQHEWVSGKPQALRRSLISQLAYSCHDNYSREIVDLVLAGLPNDLVDGMSKISNGHPHPYEDGSIVYYRANGNDFYHTHHDSYDPDDPLYVRRKQRAYTILLYLRVPSGSERVGGTEFPRLLTVKSKQSKDPIGNVLVIKPKAGDAIVFPNFDFDGRPYLDSIHGALPIPKADRSRRGRDDCCNDNDTDEVSKIVINLWFEGHTK